MHIITQLINIGKTYQYLILLSVLLFAVLPISAIAQTNTDENDKAESTGEEVVVSASRVSVPAKHVGSSVTVFDKKDISKRNVTHVHEMLREVPGLAVSQYSPSGLTDVRIRGSESNHTLVLFDGIELSDPAFYDGVYFQHLPAFAADRIEVLRGPQSSIYGSEAIGGVIDITSPIPDEGTTAIVSVEQGSLRTTKLNSYVAFASGGSYGSVAMSQTQSRGISAKSDNTEADGLRQTSAHLKVGTQISNEMEITASTLLVNSDGDYDGCSWPSSNNCRGEDKKRASSIGISYEQPDGGFVHSIKLFDTRHKRNEVAKGVWQIPTLGKKSKVEYQAVINWEARETNQTTIVALNKEKNRAIGQYVARGKGGTFDTKSVIIEQRVDFGNDVFASLSGRYDDNANDGFKDYKTYRGTLAWIANDDLRIHSSAGTGVKNPQVSELYGSGADWCANPDLRPETSKSWDFGAEFRPVPGNLTFDVTYFENKVTDLIESEQVENCISNNQSGIGKSVNKPGVSTIKGWELSMLGTLADKYDVTASATFLQGFNSEQKELIRRPSKSLTLNISRKFTHSGKSGSINLNMRHVGKQLDYTSWPNVADLPEYTLVNLGATMNLNSKLELTGKIENLFDEKYSELRGYNKPGRTWQVGIRYTF
ncbi:MAG: TonB-dependent receptor [Acidiferrobacterales bacterium]|nr:TonB-dependent receptor [Acidiferrobacterales bacterium]